MSKREREDAEEQAFFDRVTDFQKRNFNPGRWIVQNTSASHA